MLQTLVPKEDEAIGSALAEVDVKLSAWLEAMNAAQRALEERAASVERVVGVQAPVTRAQAEAQALAEAQVEVEAEAETEVNAESRAPDPSPGTSEATKRFTEGLRAELEAVLAEEAQHARETSEPEPLRPEPPKLVRSPSSATRGIVSYVTAEPAAEPETADQAARDQSTEDDEALLATLDEKTVKALRVMRRLSPVKRSMRELLAEYQAEQGMKPDDAPSPARTSWWKRK